MSASTPRIEARAGYTYLTTGGRQWRIVSATARLITYRDLAMPAYPVTAWRSEVEPWLESVIE